MIECMKKIARKQNMVGDEKVNSWTFEETVKTAENLMKNEKNIFKWDVLRHLKDFAETYQKEIQQYRTIGTVEECRVAVEKQKAKKIEIFNGQASCPNCKCLFGGMDVIKSLIAWHMPHCRECGQHIDWSEEE